MTRIQGSQSRNEKNVWRAAVLRKRLQQQQEQEHNVIVRTLSSRVTTQAYRWVDTMLGAWIPTWAVSKIRANRETHDGSMKDYVVTCDQQPSLSVCGLGMTVSDAQDLVTNIFPVVSMAYDILVDVSSSYNASSQPIEAHIVYFPLAKKRFIPADMHIKPEDFNGGLTSMHPLPHPTNVMSSSSVSSSSPRWSPPWRVIVYRREDAAKVMIHELIHLFRLDGDLVDENVERKWMDKFMKHLAIVSFPINRVNIREAVTETLACYLFAELSAMKNGNRIGVMIGRRIDRIAASLELPIRDGTHAFAYMICRSILWDGHRPSDAFFNHVNLLGRGKKRTDNTMLFDLILTRIPEWTLRMQSITSTFYKGGSSRIKSCSITGSF